MLDIKFIRENPDIVKADLKKRKDNEKLKWLDDLIKKDGEYRILLQQSQKLRHKRNELTLKINKLKKENKNISNLLKEAKSIPEKIKSAEEKLKELKDKVTFYLMRIPNILHESVPYGLDEAENVEIKKWGRLKKFNFELKSHGNLLENLNIADFKKAAEVSGAGFYYMIDELAQLNLALMQFAIDFLVKKGYKLFIPPLMLRRRPYEGVTDLADFENVMYKVEDEDLYLIATSEHPIAAYFMGETLKEENLPIKIVGMSPCFRKEIGSRGVDTKGLFRVHQFWKIEQFIFCKPEDSWKFHEELQENSEKLYQKLNLPYRVVNICTGDIGIAASKKYDIEAWFPRQNKYGEVGSNANCTAYQSRRLNIRYINKKGEKEFIHTLNNTAIATSRTLVAILENYQNKDSSVSIPTALQKYMGGLKRIQKKQ